MSKWNCTNQIHPACSNSPSQSPQKSIYSCTKQFARLQDSGKQVSPGTNNTHKLTAFFIPVCTEKRQYLHMQQLIQFYFTTLKAFREEKNWRYSEPKIACLSISFFPLRFFYWLQLIFYGLANFDIFLCIKEVDWVNGPCQQVVLSLELVLPTPGILESFLNYFLVNMYIYIETYRIMLTMSLLWPILPFLWMTLSSPFTLFITVLNPKEICSIFSMESRIFLRRAKTDVIKIM